jgi:hypothetical protein
MKRKIGLLFTLLGALALGACATFGDMDKGLASLMGQDAEVAFNVLGYPSNKQQFGDKTVYTWVRNQSSTLVTPQTVPSGTGYTTYNTYTPVNYNCKITLVANPSGKLVKWGYDGNLGGCGPYIRWLNNYRKKNEQQTKSQ